MAFRVVDDKALKFNAQHFFLVLFSLFLDDDDWYNTFESWIKFVFVCKDHRFIF